MRFLSHTKASSPDTKAYLTIFLTAIAVRALFHLFIDDPSLFTKYPFFAERLAQGEDIGTRLIDLSPFYLYFMTGLKKMLNLEWTWVKVIQSFVGVLNCMVLYALGTRVFRREIGFLGALIYALYGNLIILESTLEPTVFILLFNLLCVYCLFRTQEDFGHPGRSLEVTLWAGFFAGLSIITKPNSLLLLPLGAVWLLFFADKNIALRKRIKMAVLFCCLATAIVLPVTVRNYLKFNDFVLVTADGGKVFFHGSGKGATALEGTGLPDEGFAEESRDEPDYAHVLYRETAARLSGKALSPSESSKFWFNRALQDIIEDPMAYIRLELRKLSYFFNNYEMHYIASAYKEYISSRAYPMMRFGLIATFALLGMVLSLPGFRRVSLIYGMVALYLFSGMVFLVQSRYRTPAVPYLCLFAGYSLWTLKQWVAEKRFAFLGLALALGGVFLILTHFVMQAEIHRVDQWQRATKLHYQAGAARLFKRGEYKEAISELNACLAITPNFSPAYNLRGKSLAILGRHEEALSDFKKVISLSPNLADGYKNAGFLYLLQKDKEKARAYLTKARALAPDDEKVTRALMDLK